MKVVFISLLFLLITTSAHSKITEDVYCFDAGGMGSRNFELHVLHSDPGKWSGGFIKYQSAKLPITLVLKELTSEELSENAPDQVTATWLEVYGGKIIGEYEMISQGGNIYSMVYMNFRAHKKIGFIFNPDALSSGGNACIW